jgi:Flp pilus assembly protein TadD
MRVLPAALIGLLLWPLPLRADPPAVDGPPGVEVDPETPGAEPDGMLAKPDPWWAAFKSGMTVDENGRGSGETGGPDPFVPETGGPDPIVPETGGPDPFIQKVEQLAQKPGSEPGLNGLANKVEAYLQKKSQTDGAAPPDPAMMKLLQKMDERLRKLNELAKQKSPNDPNVLSRSARQNLRDGAYEAALRDAKNALLKGAKDAGTYAAYGAASLRLGDQVTASHAASLALQADPANADALALARLAHGPLNLSGITDAQRTAQKGPPRAQDDAGPSPALRDAPASMPSAASQGARAAAQGTSAYAARDFASAYTLASEATALEPGNVQAWNIRAFAGLRLRRYADAETDATTALALSPGNPQSLQARSWARARQKKYLAALADANAALERDPYNGYHYQNRAYAQAGTGDKAGALESLRKSAEQDPQFVSRFETALQSAQDSDLLFLFDEKTLNPAWTRPKGRDWRAVKRRAVFVLGPVFLLIALWSYFTRDKDEEAAPA